MEEELRAKIAKINSIEYANRLLEYMVDIIIDQNNLIAQLADIETADEYLKEQCKVFEQM